MKGCDEGGNKMQVAQVDQTDEEVEATNKQMFSAREKARQKAERKPEQREAEISREEERQTEPERETGREVSPTNFLCSCKSSLPTWPGVLSETNSPFSSR